MRSLILLLGLALSIQAAEPPVYKIAKGEKLVLKITVPEEVQYAKWQSKGVAIAENSAWGDPLHPELTFVGVNPGTDVLWVVMPHGVGHVYIEVTGDAVPPKAVVGPKDNKFPTNAPEVNLNPTPVVPPTVPPPAPAPPPVGPTPAPAAPAPAPAVPPKPLTVVSKPAAKNLRTPSPFVHRPSLEYPTTAAAKSTPLPAFNTGPATIARLAEGNSSCGTVPSATATTRTYAPAIGLNGGTGRAAVSG